MTTFETITITDPSGRRIMLPDDLNLRKGDFPSKPPVLTDFRKAIETPACIIEVPPNRVYYFRSVGRNFTILIEAVYEEEEWIAVNCEKNPSGTFIAPLLRKGNFIPGTMLGEYGNSSPAPATLKACG